jgi:hypothetical protein
MIVVHAEEFTEERQAQRYRLALTVELEHGTGRTRDISSSGMFFVTDQFFTLGQSIRFTLLVEHVDPGHSSRMQCQGTVVRVEPQNGHLGVAVAFTEYQFESPVSKAG